MLVLFCGIDIRRGGRKGDVVYPTATSFSEFGILCFWIMGWFYGMYTFSIMLDAVWRYLIYFD